MIREGTHEGDGGVGVVVAEGLPGEKGGVRGGEGVMGRGLEGEGWRERGEGKGWRERGKEWAHSQD